jgi:hypothetical protein
MARRKLDRTRTGAARVGSALWPSRRRTSAGGAPASRAGGGGRRLRSHQLAAAIDAAVASCSAGVGRPATASVAALAAGIVAAPGAPPARARPPDGWPPGSTRPGGDPGQGSGDDSDDGHGIGDHAARAPGSDAGQGPGDAAHGPVDRALARALVEAVATAWRLGWQPADLHRAVARLRGRAHARLVVVAIARETAQHPLVDLPARWRLQLDAIGVAVPPDRSAERPGAWAVGGGTSRLAGVTVAVETLAALRSLPRLPRLGPAPGDVAPAARGRPPDRSVGADPGVLHKVTSLLAKAESTSFPDEAEALTAKAQQLMTRHAIDRATLDAGAGSGAGRRGPVGGRRLGIDDPYAGARYLLLSLVADANRCRAVWSKYWGFATVFGDEADLDAVELLYTSLLVQATRAMVAAQRSGGAGRAGGGGRTRSYRQSFLIAFARRIGARLREAADAVTSAGAAHSTALVPLFVARRRAAEEAADEAFPRVTATRMSANDAAGWHAGTEAGSRAQLDHHGVLRP